MKRISIFVMLLGLATSCFSDDWYYYPYAYNLDHAVKSVSYKAATSAQQGFVSFKVDGEGGEKEFIYRFAKADLELAKGYLSILLTARSANKKVRIFATQNWFNPPPCEFDIVTLTTIAAN